MLQQQQLQQQQPQLLTPQQLLALHISAHTSWRVSKNRRTRTGVTSIEAGVVDAAKAFGCYNCCSSPRHDAAAASGNNRQFTKIS